MVVPWHATYVLPELNLEERSLGRLSALARYSANATAAIVFDCIPITSSETSSDGLPALFASYLAALKHFDRLAPISMSAAIEYRGWRTMISSAGTTGPEIEERELPLEAHREDLADTHAAKELLVEPGYPMLLCVGSHEPRKNHLAVLHAAELLWRDGLRFSLVFVGGNAWKSGSFTAELERLKSQGRPVKSLTGVADSMLWAAYRIATGVVFPSLNEGYGLPVAESLAVGTPVVTSNFGSMLEIASLGGAVLVDPRDDLDLAAGMRSLLESGPRSQRLRAEAGMTPIRTWDDYSAAVWTFLTAGRHEARPAQN